MKALKCTLYLIFISILSLFFGRLIPQKLIDPERFPFKPFRFEHRSEIYEKLRVRKWQGKLPDISKILPSIVPRKKLVNNDLSRLPMLIKETCVAEIVHSSVSFLSWGCVFIAKDPVGLLFSILYQLCNLPYIIAQRYNRPRMMKICKMQASRAECGVVSK